MFAATIGCSTCSTGDRCAGSIWCRRRPNPASARTCVSMAGPAQVLEQVVMQMDAVQARPGWGGPRADRRGSRRRSGEMAPMGTCPVIRWRSVSQLGERASRQWYNNHPPSTRDVRHAVRRRHAHRQPRGHHTAGAAGASRRSTLIAAEDTRRTARLLAHHGIPTPTLSFHEHNTRGRVPQLVARLRARRRRSPWSPTPERQASPTRASSSCRRASTAGIPSIRSRASSAPLTAAIASGFPADSADYPRLPPCSVKRPNRCGSRRFRAIEHTLTFFESPHRIAQTIAEAATIFGR